MCSRRRRLSLPQTPMSTPSNPAIFPSHNGHPFVSRPVVVDRRTAALRQNHSLGSLSICEAIEYRNPHTRLSQPDISLHYSPLYQRRMLPTPQRQNGGGIARKLMKRCTNPDLLRFQRTSEIRDQSIARSSCEPVDPVYLALKQATGRYSRRGSSNVDSSTPSPRNLSQVSLQDSGYVDIGASKTNPLLGSTPQLDNAGRSVGRRRAPKLSQQMKSLSLDCQEMPPRINSSTRSPLMNSGGHIVIHEYTPAQGVPLILGERVRVVDNGDPDWLHGFRFNDRTEHLLTFPATCVAQMLPGEQAMRIQQNVFVAEIKLRMYRDQIVFVQPESLLDGKVTVRTEHNAYVPCPLTSLALI